MAAMMADIADSELLLRASIVGEMVTAAGIVALGTLGQALVVLAPIQGVLLLRRYDTPLWPQGAWP